MPPTELTDEQRGNVLKGIEKIQKEYGWTQAIMADEFARRTGLKRISQQAISSAIRRPTIYVAIAVASCLGVDFKELTTDGKLKPDGADLPPGFERLGARTDWAAAIKETQKFGGAVVGVDDFPSWCWKQAANFVTPDPPATLTVSYIQSLLRAIWIGATPEQRRRGDADEATSSLRQEERAPPDEVKKRFSPPSGSVPRHRKQPPAK